MQSVLESSTRTFAAVKKTWNDVKLADALKAAAIPVHPGAARCYKELGVK